MEREALKLALITLEGWDNHDKWVWPETALEQAKRNTKEAIIAIKEALAQPDEAVRQGRRMSKQGLTEVFREALAQPAQEPVVDKGFPWTQKHVATPQVFGAMPSNIPQPQREWVGLTDEDKSELAKAQHSWEDLCLAVESKLKEKNNGT